MIVCHDQSQAKQSHPLAQVAKDLKLLGIGTHAIFLSNIFYNGYRK